MKKNNYSFDVCNIECCKAIVEGITYNDKYLEEYGNINNLEWDYDALQKVIKVMLNNYRDEIKETFASETYSDFNLVTCYIYNVMAYSLVNQKPEVSYKNLLRTFKEWDYLPFTLKCLITESIITELNLDKKESPFIVKRKKVVNKKIIKFRPRN